MKVYRNIDQFEGAKNPIVTTGTFDGVHYGHKKIINRLKELAEKNNGESVLLTFYPHPRLVLNPDDTSLSLLSTLDEKVKLLEKAGIDHLIIHPFTKEFSQITSQEYIRDLLVKKIGVKKLVIGYNHQFGKNREGSFKHLNELKSIYHFDLEEIPAQDIDNMSISSTKVRNALNSGDVETANTFLGYQYHINGTVIKGDQMGRTIGFPTANIMIEEQHKLVPKKGVYAVRINVLDQSFKGMLNIGNRPTVDGKKEAIEVHIFDFDQQIYEQPIQISFVKRIREEKKFDGLDQLREQLFMDKTRSISILNEVL